MNEQEALARMVPPSQRRPNKEGMLGGIIQVMITSACDKACFHCTQGSNLAGKPVMMTPDQFEQACISLKGFWGVQAVFGGNPATSPYFEDICRLVRKYVPKDRAGIWCNHPRGKARIMRETFNPARSNLNVHMDEEAYREFRRDWPESRPFGLHEDSRHAPCFVSMREVIPDEDKRWELISKCSINQNWSALVGVFRGNLRAFFCEINYSQSRINEDNPDFPDTGLDPTQTYRGKLWWQLDMKWFADQARFHCHRCSVPLHGYGALAVTEPDAREQVSPEHAKNYRPKVRGRQVEVVTDLVQLNTSRLTQVVDYLGNSRK